MLAVNSEGNSCNGGSSSWTTPSRGWILNTQYTRLVGSLSRAVGNTLAAAEEQGGKLHLTMQYNMSQEERALLRQFVQSCLPGRKIQRFSGRQIIIG
jgi:hypothetical protein